MEFGYEGLGLFYTLLEKFGKQEKPVNTKVLKAQLKIGKRLEKCWKFMEEIDLIQSKNGETFNEQLLNFSENYQIKKEKNRKKISEWRDKQKDKKNVTSNKPVRNPTKVKETKVKETKEENSKKKKYAEFVLLTEEEYNKLVDEHTIYWTKKMIEMLDNYKGSSGKNYKSDYRAILSWVKDKLKDSSQYRSWKTKKMKEEAQNKARNESKIMDTLQEKIPEIENINKLEDNEELV